MKTARLRNSARILRDDETSSVVIADLEAMSQQDRNAVLAFLDFWRDLPREDRALFARSLKPEVSDEEVA